MDKIGRFEDVRRIVSKWARSDRGRVMERTGRRPTSRRPIDRPRKGSSLGRIAVRCPHTNEQNNSTSPHVDSVLGTHHSVLSLRLPMTYKAWYLKAEV